jgi:hypothetical protein
MSDKPKPSHEYCLTSQDKLVRHVCSGAGMESVGKPTDSLLFVTLTLKSLWVRFQER